MKKILLIDGNSILNRAFYGLPLLTNKDGIHTNAVLGFLNIILKVIDEEKATNIFVAFDVKAKTFRHDMFEEYKGTRNPMPDELREQLPLIKEVLSAMNVVTYEQAGIEADDILGTLSRKAHLKGYVVSVLSGDRDLLQLATDDILIKIPKTKAGKTTIENYYAKDVASLYGVDPITFIDMKGLMGDKSDNIPGVPGIGEKTAAKLLIEYKSMESLYEKIDELKPSKIKENLVNNKDLAFLSKKLATIKLDCDINIDFEKTSVDCMFNEKACEIFRRLELKSLLNRINEKGTVSEKKEFKPCYVIVDDYDEYKKVLNASKKAKIVGFSYITNNEECLGLSLSFDNKAYIIPFINFLTFENVKNDLDATLDEIKELACLNIKSNLPYLTIKDINNIYDVSVMAYLINPLKDKYTYDDLADSYLDLTVKDEKTLLGKEGFNSMFYMDENQCVAASYLAMVPELVKDELKSLLMEQNMFDLYKNIELPCLFALYDMERNGIMVDKEALLRYGEKLDIRIKELEESIHELAGKNFNINSTKQLGEVLFEDLGLKCGKKTKTGYSTSVEVLEKIQNDHEIIPLILEYRQLTKLNSTYVVGLSSFIRQDGRIHGKFNQTVTATGRISSTEPNLQNIPTRYPLGREIRKVFVADEGYILLDADYSQIELRVLAHFSNDDSLIGAYNKDKDIHSITASEVFDVPIEQVDSTMRRKAKAVNFGIVYGISSFGLGQDLDVSRKEAESYKNKYFETYKGVKKYLDDTVAFAKNKGYSITMYNRRRPIPEMNNKNYMIKSFGERVAMNSPIQGTAADIIKIAMINVNNELKERKLSSKIVLQVHDELLIETKIEELEEVKEILSRNMMNASSLKVPLVIDMNEGVNWYEAK